MADTIRKNKNNTLRKALPKEDKGVYKMTTKLTTSICVEGAGLERKLIFKHDGVRDCIPLPAEWGGGGIVDCSGVANCIDNSPEVTQAILNFLATHDIVFNGHITFEDTTVTYINTTIEGGTYVNQTIYNPTIIGAKTAKYEWYNEGPMNGDAAGTVFNLTYVPIGDIIISMVGGVIQLEPGDYTHVQWENKFTLDIDTTGQEILVSYIATIIPEDNMLFNEIPLAGGTPGTVITLTNIPVGDVIVSFEGGLIQEPGVDYTHAGNTITMTNDTTGQNILVTYVMGGPDAKFELFNEATQTGGIIGTSIPLTHEPKGDVFLSILGWVIQIDNTDYHYDSVTNSIVLDVDMSGNNIVITYLKLLTLPLLKFTTTLTPAIWVPYAVTHGLGTEDIIAQIWDVATKTKVDLNMEIIDSNTIEVTSTTTDTVKIVII